MRVLWHFGKAKNEKDDYTCRKDLWLEGVVLYEAREEVRTLERTVSLAGDLKRLEVCQSQLVAGVWRKMEGGGWSWAVVSADTATNGMDVNICRTLCLLGKLLRVKEGPQATAGPHH